MTGAFLADVYRRARSGPSEKEDAVWGSRVRFGNFQHQSTQVFRGVLDVGSWNWSGDEQLISGLRTHTDDFEIGRWQLRARCHGDSCRPAI